MSATRRKSQSRPGFLQRLARDPAGNTAAIMAAALLPLAGFTGAALDTARLYVVKVRLQQSCDAGALAGRKMMLGASLTDANKEQAKLFFDNNFKSGWFKTANVSFEATDTDDGQVKGTASVKVPVTLMSIFGAGPTTLTVTCEARKEIGDVDVMFVLDTTGSMSCTPSDAASCVGATKSYVRPDGTTGYYAQEKSGSKISALRQAVLDFYDTLEAVADPSTHIRYGFVPYTSAVNIGRDLPSNLLSSNGGDYQTRRPWSDSDYGSADTDTLYGVSKTACNNKAGRSPSTPLTYAWDNEIDRYAAKVTTVSSWSSNNGGTCTLKTQNVIPKWRYMQVKSTDSYWNANLASYIATLSGGAGVLDPSKVDGSRNKWQGCVETNTNTLATIDPASPPWDIDPDYVPTDDAHRWRPMWPEQIYYRGNNNTYDTTSDLDNIGGDPSYLGGGYVSCGKPAQRLTEMTRTAVNDYVNASDFKPIGGTYHDVGMIWGARLISPTGPFAADTASWPNRTAPDRNIIFMTDGNMAPNQYIYGQYGFEDRDQRVSGGTFSSLTARHNSRFLAACEAAKARGITVWVVAFSAATSLTAEEKACASPGRAYFASDAAALKAKFKEIAGKIAELRISK